MTDDREAIREVLCRRLHEHNFTDQKCDGRHVVCGFCDNTVRQQLDAMKEPRKDAA